MEMNLKKKLFYVFFAISMFCGALTLICGIRFWENPPESYQWIYPGIISLAGTIFTLKIVQEIKKEN